MDDISKRFSSLTPEQLALLKLRLKKQGLRPPVEHTAAGAEADSPAQATEQSEEDLDWKSKPSAKS